MKGLSVFVHDEDALRSVKRKLQSFQGVTLYESYNALHESMFDGEENMLLCLTITLSLVLDNALYEEKVKLEVNRASFPLCVTVQNTKTSLPYLFITVESELSFHKFFKTVKRGVLLGEH